MAEAACDGRPECVEDASKNVLEMRSRAADRGGAEHRKGAVFRDVEEGDGARVLYVEHRHPRRDGLFGQYAATGRVRGVPAAARGVSIESARKAGGGVLSISKAAAAARFPEGGCGAGWGGWKWAP